MSARMTVRGCGYGLLVVVAILGWCLAAQAQNPPGGQASGGRSAPAAQGGASYILRTYEVGDLVIIIRDHAFGDSMQPVQPVGRGFGGGGGGFGGGGGGGVFSVPDEAGGFGRVPNRSENNPFASAEGRTGTTGRFQFAQLGGSGGGRGQTDTEAAGPTASITIPDLVRVLTNTVAADTWSINGGEGRVEPLGTTLVVWQEPKIHDRIGELLDKLRKGSAERRTVTIDARWLMLNSDELDSLVPADQKGVPQVDREQLARLTRRPGSIRGMTNCLSSQLVYIVSGTMKNVVGGFIPVVGSVEFLNPDVQLVGSGTGPRIHFVADRAAANAPQVGYQPLITNLNFGALLEIRPTLVPLAQPEAAAVVDLKSTVTVEGDTRSGAEPKAASDELAPAVDRVAIETLGFATTLRVPLGKPVLVGGLTYIPSSAGAGESNGAEQAGRGVAAEKPQLYLVLEVR